MATSSDVSAGLPQRARGISSADLLLALDAVRDDIRDDLFRDYAESFQEQYRFTPVQIGAPSGVAAGVAGNVDNGTYRYRVSYTTPEQEIMMGDISDKVVISDNSSDGQVSLTGVPTGASALGVTNRKVYRQQNGSGSYNLVGTISDNTTTTFTDNVDQTTVAAAAAGKWGFTLPSDFYYELSLKDGSRQVPILKRSQVRNEVGDDGITTLLDRIPGTHATSRYYAWIDYNDLTISFPRNHQFDNELNLMYRTAIADATAGTLPYPTNLQDRLLPALRLGVAFFYLADNKSGEGEMIGRLQVRYDKAKEKLFPGSVSTLY